MRYEIRDWMNNLLWNGITFGTFEDGWSHIYTECPEPDRNSPEWLDGWFDDFYVVPMKEEKSND